MDPKEIEKFFLTSLLKITIGGVLFILISDVLLYSQDTLSIIIDISILSACLVSYFIRKRFATAAVLILTSIILVAMTYQSLAVPFNTTTSLSIILAVGFIFSVMLQGPMLYGMHLVTLFAINMIFLVQYIDPAFRGPREPNEIITVAITYSILYVILVYATAVLKDRYDKLFAKLLSANNDLYEKTMEIEAQNEELQQIQSNLHELNTDLERMVIERTESLNAKTEKLLNYSYTNAHHLRGPVARLLGLVMIQRLESDPDNSFYFTRIEEQALEIDDVIKKINSDLEKSANGEHDVDFYKKERIISNNHEG